MNDQVCVSLDLETTGLDKEKDQIIEIGAVKFRGTQILETFQTLINPYRPLPYRIHRLTGITTAELDAAPPLSSVIPAFLEFLSGHAIVGQNVTFDLEFLQAQGLAFTASIYDVLDVANILLPVLPDYSLITLARYLDVPYPIHHRALADAAVVKDVFLAIQERASQLDPAIITEINRLTRSSSWPWRVFFAELEQLSFGNVSALDRKKWESDLFPSATRRRDTKALSPAAITKPLDMEWITSQIGADGTMARVFPGFDYRPGQAAMLQAVVHALNDCRHQVVEAGTGIGKSVAYLLPAMVFASENNCPVIISTNTINLQEQLIHKDVPDLLTVISEAGALRPGRELKVAQLKGRTNYCCLRRWNLIRMSSDLSWEDTRALLRMLLWVSSTRTGDRAEMNLNRTEFDLWNRVCASEEGCAGARCPYYGQKCFLHAARQEAQGAHLVVVNHALLLSDLIRGGILPEYQHLIVDEAHHLEEEATDQLGSVVRSRDLLHHLDFLAPRGGFIRSLRQYFRGIPLSSESRRGAGEKMTALGAGSAEARKQAIALLDQLISFVRSQHPSEPGDYERHLRITREIRRQAGWTEVRSAWENLSLELQRVEGDLEEVLSTMDSSLASGDTEASGYLAEALSLRQEIAAMRHRMNSIISKPEADSIYWITVTAQEECRLHAAPLNVGDLLNEYLFSRKNSVVLTSATLAVGGDFSFYKESIGLEEADALAIEAPFDYRNSTMIYLPEDIPEPDRAGYQHAVARAIVDLCCASEGRALALFTSHSALRTAYAAVQDPLEKESILVLGQGIDGGPKKLLTRFRENPRSVLMGAASFWEGVDVVGPALSVLIIVRLPFGVPTDPIAAARAERFEDPFNQYSVPRAALKFKQGFGRLIRSREDRGAVVILDRRIQTKAYGRVFLESLPPCTVHRGLLRQMPRKILSWLSMPISP